MSEEMTVCPCCRQPIKPDGVDWPAEMDRCECTIQALTAHYAAVKRRIMAR